MSSNMTPMTVNPSLATPRSEEPASEWASSTLSALKPAHEESSTLGTVGQSATPATTPGVNMPGGFPGAAPKLTGDDVQQAKEVALSALETATQYAQSAALSAQTVAANAAQSASVTVGSYLPASVASYLPGTGPTQPTQTLPSQEGGDNLNPSHPGGVGALPGPSGETGVALLPDERTGAAEKTISNAMNASSNNQSSPITTTTNNNPGAIPAAGTAPTSATSPSKDTSSSHTGFIPTSLKNESSLAKLPEENRTHNLPSGDSDHDVALGKSGGVGILPGATSESGVAVLPDERNATSTSTSKPLEKSQGQEKQQSATTTDGASADASIRSLAGSKHQGHTGTTPSIGQIHLNDSPNTDAREHALSKDEDMRFNSPAGDFVRKDQVSADLSGSTSKDSPIAALGDKHTTASSVATPGHEGYHSEVGKSPALKESSQDADKPPTPPKDHPLKADSGSETTRSSSPPKKSGFLGKVKGEMKVLSGKMSHNETKIEEGKKMMGKN